MWGTPSNHSMLLLPAPFLTPFYIAHFRNIIWGFNVTMIFYCNIWLPICKFLFSFILFSNEINSISFILNCFACLFTINYLFYNTTPYLSSFFWSGAAAYQQVILAGTENKELSVWDYLFFVAPWMSCNLLCSKICRFFFCCFQMFNSVMKNSVANLINS